MAGAPMAGGPMMGPPPAPKKNNTILIVVVVIVVVLALVIAGTLLALNAFNHTVNQSTDISMSVTGTRTPASSEYTISPSSGRTYVQVTISMTNNGDIVQAVSSIFFHLQASGTRYGSLLSVVNTDTYSATIPVGGTTTFKVSFDIPDTASPQKIIFTPIFGHEVSANI
jgi:hypothetical protein